MQQQHAPDRHKPILGKKQPRVALTQPPAQIGLAALLFIRDQNSISWWLREVTVENACTLAREPR